MGDRIFGGTGNVGHLFMYDTVTGQSTDLGQAVADHSAITSLIVVPADPVAVYGTTGTRVTALRAAAECGSAR